MIEAYYIGTITIDGKVSEDTPDLLPESKIRELFSQELSDEIRKVIESELGFEAPEFKVRVERRYSNVFSR